jgi:hypothetical protein
MRFGLGGTWAMVFAPFCSGRRSAEQSHAAKALEGGYPVTLNDVTKCFAGSVR